VAAPRDNTILITGAAGFAGSHLLDRLDGSGATIVGWYRPDMPAPARAGVQWRGVELIDRDSVATAIADARPAQIYHLAGAPSVETSWTNAVPHLQINALGTHYLLEAIRLAGAPCRVLVVTSAQVYEPREQALDEESPLQPSTPYGLTKLAQDELARCAAADGLGVIIARPFNHIGPRQTAGFAIASFARQIARIEAGLDAPLMRVGNLEPRRDLSDVRDVVDAYVRLMASGATGRAYNVCSGIAHRMGDVLDALLGLATVSVERATDLARLRPNDVPIVVGDATRMRSEIGWSPHIPIDTTLRDTLEWWRAEVRANR
jgi:GDP-4-dehydro-6-deoxy-D-mannose reductase